MTCCLNPDCPNPLNPEGINYCQSCGTTLVKLLNGSYRVIRPLGQGGFGKTYLGKDIHKFDQPCVVKQLTPIGQGNWAQNKAVQLFEQEARQLQALGSEHPQIPGLYGYFEQDGYLYLVQQFIDGQNLSELLQQEGVWRETEIRELLLDLLPILQFVHEQRVIHRDIKPENIIRRRSDGRLVLIDFGVSKQLSGTVMTQMGTQVGSSGYAPLEQIQGGEVYPASDLFSLGATCFHLRTGIHPFQLWTEYGYSWTANWREYCLVSDELAEVFDRLLAKDIDQRYQSAKEVREDLQQKMQTMTLSTTPVVPENKPLPSPPSGTKRLWVLSGAIAAVVLSGLIGTQIYGFLRYGLSPFSQMFLMTIWQSNVSRVKTLTSHASLVNSVTISPDGQTLASGYADGKIERLSLETGEKIVTFTGNSREVSSVAIDPDGKILASASHDKTIGLWRLDTLEAIATLKGHADKVNSVVIGPDGKILASASNDLTIRLWSLETGEAIATLEGHADRVRVVAIGPHGKILASGSSDRTVKLWDLETGEAIATLKGHTDEVRTLAISPDGKILASGCDDKTIKLWNLETGEAIATLKGRLIHPIRTVAFSPDGKTLVSHDGGYIKSWNLETFTEIPTPMRHFNSVRTIAFSPDGKTLVSGSLDKTIKIWRMP